MCQHNSYHRVSWQYVGNSNTSHRHKCILCTGVGVIASTKIATTTLLRSVIHCLARYQILRLNFARPFAAESYQFTEFSFISVSIAIANTPVCGLSTCGANPHPCLIIDSFGTVHMIHTFLFFITFSSVAKTS